MAIIAMVTILGLAALVAGFLIVLATQPQGKSKPRTTCVKCGYSRVGLPQDQPCPECGTIPVVKTRVKAGAATRATPIEPATIIGAAFLVNLAIGAWPAIGLGAFAVLLFVFGNMLPYLGLFFIMLVLSWRVTPEAARALTWAALLAFAPLLILADLFLITRDPLSQINLVVAPLFAVPLIGFGLFAGALVIQSETFEQICNEVPTSRS